jgi:hypothetical protein
VRSHARVGLTSQIQPAGVDATTYAAKLPDGAISVVVLNKDPKRDLELTLDFGADRSSAVKMEVCVHRRLTHARPASRVNQILAR